MGAGIAADGTRSDNSYLPTHAFLPAGSPSLARRPGASQRLKRVAREDRRGVLTVAVIWLPISGLDKRLRNLSGYVFNMP